jgi:hypothetical protein
MHTPTDRTTDRNTLLTEWNIKKTFRNSVLQRTRGSQCDKLGGVSHHGNCKAWNFMNLLKDMHTFVNTSANYANMHTKLQIHEK